MSARDQRPDGSPWPISPYLTSGIELADYLNSVVESIDTNNFGSSRPSYTEAGGIWSKQEADDSIGLYLFTGSGDVKIGSSDGVTIDIINTDELLQWIEEYVNVGVKTFNDRLPDEDGNITPAEGDYTLTQLGDVALTDVQKDDYIQWNGSSWENNPPALIETELNFMGGYDVTTPPPAGPSHGDMYINNNEGNADNGWTGIAGQFVNVGNAMGYSANHDANGNQVPEGTGGRWFLLGEVFTGGITDIGEGAGISVDSSNPSEPVISVNRATVNTWYSDYNHRHDGSHITSGKVGFSYLPTGTTNTSVAIGNHGHSEYATSGHNHINEYSPLGHTHTEYEPKFTKRSGFNKAFGTGYDNVAYGNHTHSEYVTSTHEHPASKITTGTFKSGTYRFPGAVTAVGDITAYYSSDERLKKDLKPLEGMEIVSKLKGYRFKWDDEKCEELEMEQRGEDVGVIAQEVMEVLPEVCIVRDNSYIGVRYDKLVPTLIQAINELQAQIDELKGDD